MAFECFYCYFELVWTLLWTFGIGGAAWWAASNYHRGTLFMALSIAYMRAGRIVSQLIDLVGGKRKQNKVEDPHLPTPDSEDEEEVEVEVEEQEEDDGAVVVADNANPSIEMTTFTSSPQAAAELQANACPPVTADVNALD